MSVTAPRDPRLVAIVTVAPPTPTRFPPTSRAVTVTIDGLLPSAGILPGAATIVDVPASGTPGAMLIV